MRVVDLHNVFGPCDGGEGARVSASRGFSWGSTLRLNSGTAKSGSTFISNVVGHINFGVVGCSEPW